MKRSITKALTLALAASLMCGALASCSKNSKGKSIEEAVDGFTDGYQEIGIDDINDLKLDDLENGVLLITDGEELAENDAVNDALDSLSSEMAGLSLANMIDFNSMQTIKVGGIVSGDTEDLNTVEAAIAGCIVFEDADAACKLYDDVDRLLSMAMALFGVDMDDFSEDEYYFDDDDGEGHLVVNVTMEEVIGSLFDSMASMFGDGVTTDDSQELTMDSSLVIAVRLDGDSILFTIAIGEESVAATDDIHDACGFDLPSEVTSCDSAKRIVGELASNLLMRYMMAAFEAMSSN